MGTKMNTMDINAELSLNVEIELKYRKIIVFDVETTGLLPKFNKDTPITNEMYPHILQLSFIVYDLELNKIERVYDSYVRVGEHVVISDQITKITGITREHCNRGMPIEHVLMQFYYALIKCDCAVAHNISYDTRVIQQEMFRNREILKLITSDYRDMISIFGKRFCEFKNIRLYCTMKCGTDLCNLTTTRIQTTTITDLSGNTETKETPIVYKKTPKLSELYTKLFDQELPQNMHNSIIDVLVCLQCFLSINHCGVLSNEAFENLCKKYAPL